MRNGKSQTARFLVAVALLAPTVLHGLFHLADWLVWGMRRHDLAPLREGLLPYFGHTTQGLVFHAIVGWTNLVLIGLLLDWWLRAERRHGASQSRSTDAPDPAALGLLPNPGTAHELLCPDCTLTALLWGEEEVSWA